MTSYAGLVMTSSLTVVLELLELVYVNCGSALAIGMGPFDPVDWMHEFAGQENDGIGHI